jgi:hypothetical protein
MGGSQRKVRRLRESAGIRLRIPAVAPAPEEAVPVPAVAPDEQRLPTTDDYLMSAARMINVLGSEHLTIPKLLADAFSWIYGCF